jgi:methionyl-tRNA synthetase
MSKTFYITTPIYYVNDAPHIGHAYTTIASDVLARFKRLDGFEVMFLTGTDEHGQKIEKSAAKAGVDIQSFTDKFSETFRSLNKTLNISNDDFIRTTEPRHKKTVQEIWKKLLASGNIYLGSYSGWYAVRDEAFYAESEIVDGKAPTGAEVEWITEPSYFFKLSAWQDKLLKFYDDHPDFIAPTSRRNEVLSFVKGGLHDLSVSRTSFKWGIPIPNDEHHVMYVWLDALFNYYSAIHNEERQHFWPCDLHIVGKDILRFHAIYWPAFLMACNLPLPKRVYAHGWWTNDGEKISKSLGNTIDPVKLIEEFNLDYVRYFLMTEMPFGNDGNYSRSAFINKVNSHLCNNIGNLAQRVLSFINKNCDAKIPTFDLQEVDSKLLESAYSLADKMRVHLDNQEIHLAFEAVINLGSAANEYVDHQAPWSLKKTDPERMNSVLYTLTECLRIIGIALQSIIPDSACKLLDQLNISDREIKNMTKDYALKAGTDLPIPQGIFPRLQN